MGLDVCLANGHVSKGEFVGRVRGLVEMKNGWYFFYNHEPTLIHISGSDVSRVTLVFLYT